MKKTSSRSASLHDDPRIYTPDAAEEFIQKALSDDFLVRKRGGKERPRYYNVAAAFDIETTSVDLPGDQKAASMYIWQLGISGYCMIGRTWEEFTDILTYISEKCQLSKDKRLLIYIHNLSYEFQFFRKHVEIESLFALDQRRPVKVLLKNGIEFRCSYILSGYSLATVGKNLTKYKVEKKSGDLDYSLYRHSDTPMTEMEIGYCINDIRVVMAYIQEKIEQDGNITKIQLTKTGYVRKLCRAACFDHFSDYRKIMYNLVLQPEEYELCKRAFQGGFTHASALNSGKTFFGSGPLTLHHLILPSWLRNGIRCLSEGKFSRRTFRNSRSIYPSIVASSTFASKGSKRKPYWKIQYLNPDAEEL